MRWMESVVKSKEGEEGRRYNNDEGEKPTSSFLWQKPLRKLILLIAQRIVIDLEDEDLPTSVLELKNTLQKQLTVTFMCF